MNILSSPFWNDLIPYCQRCSSKKHGFHTFRERNNFHRCPYVLSNSFLCLHVSYETIFKTTRPMSYWSVWITTMNRFSAFRWWFQPVEWCVEFDYMKGVSLVLLVIIFLVSRRIHSFQIIRSNYLWLFFVLKPISWFPLLNSVLILEFQFWWKQLFSISWAL